MSSRELLQAYHYRLQHTQAAWSYHAPHRLLYAKLKQGSGVQKPPGEARKAENAHIRIRLPANTTGTDNVQTVLNSKLARAYEHWKGGRSYMTRSAQHLVLRLPR